MSDSKVIVVVKENGNVTVEITLDDWSLQEVEHMMESLGSSTLMAKEMMNNVMRALHPV